MDGGKRNAPEEWMEEDDLLLENELREKVQGGQDQKRRIQGNQQRGFQNPGTQYGYHDTDGSRFDSPFWGVGHDSSSQAKGWHEDPSREHKVPEGGFCREIPAWGLFRGGFGQKGDFHEEQLKSRTKWGDSAVMSKKDDLQKGWGESSPNTRVLRAED